MLLGTSYRATEVLEYVTSAMPEQSCESLGSVSNDIRDEKLIQTSGCEVEGLPTKTSATTFD